MEITNKQNLWIQLCMLEDGEKMQVDKSDDDDLSEFRDAGFIRGKRWIFLTPKGKARRDRTSS